MATIMLNDYPLFVRTTDEQARWDALDGVTRERMVLYYRELVVGRDDPITLADLETAIRFGLD